jgi:hypothetical protein
MKLVIHINMNFVATNSTFYVYAPCTVTQICNIHQQNVPFLNLEKVHFVGFCINFTCYIIHFTFYTSDSLCTVASDSTTDIVLSLHSINN